MKHPYSGLPDRQFWKKEPGVKKPSELDPVGDAPFEITPTDRIVTAGSCFAQHVARVMTESGFNHHITEFAHPALTAGIGEAHNYGMYSARYGNVYTARQLKQLLLRATGEFTPVVEPWKLRDSDNLCDPFRPQIQPGGYLSEAELEADRAFHLSCVRKAIEEMDVFVFTLGLTETWQDPRDGAVFPIAPGVAGGTYNRETVEFVNFDETETYADLRDALNIVRSINPEVKIILTVSPVALNATYEDRHVLLSTVWSKAVLRISAEKATREFDDCIYFPSFEIITSPHVQGRYFAEDRREVTPAGVKHVMSLFFKHYTSGRLEGEPDRAVDKPAAMDTQSADVLEALEAFCDEASIDND